MLCLLRLHRTSERGLKSTMKPLPSSITPLEDTAYGHGMCWPDRPDPYKETKSESLEVVNWRIRRLHYNHHHVRCSITFLGSDDCDVECGCDCDDASGLWCWMWVWLWWCLWIVMLSVGVIVMMAVVMIVMLNVGVIVMMPLDCDVECGCDCDDGCGDDCDVECGSWRRHGSQKISVPSIWRLKTPWRRLPVQHDTESTT